MIGMQKFVNVLACKLELLQAEGTHWNLFVDRHTGDIVRANLLDENNEPMIAWSVARAWPVKWQIAAFNAKADQVAMETLEFAHAMVERKLVKPKGLTGMLNA